MGPSRWSYGASAPIHEPYVCRLLRGREPIESARTPASSQEHPAPRWSLRGRYPRLPMPSARPIERIIVGASPRGSRILRSGRWPRGTSAKRTASISARWRTRSSSGEIQAGRVSPTRGSAPPVERSGLRFIPSRTSPRNPTRPADRFTAHAERPLARDRRGWLETTWLAVVVIAMGVLGGALMIVGAFNGQLANCPYCGGLLGASATGADLAVSPEPASVGCERCGDYLTTQHRQVRAADESADSDSHEFRVRVLRRWTMATGLRRVRR